MAKRCVAELHELERAERDLHLRERPRSPTPSLTQWPRKLNDEALGNSVRHLHWWLTPRHHDDPRPEGPAWQDPDLAEPPWGRWQPPPARRDEIRGLVLVALRDREVVIERAFC